MTDEILVKGIWCTACEFLETSDSIHDGQCEACGCPAESHIDVKVVPA